MLRDNLADLRREYRLGSLWLFESYVRGEQHMHCDLDVLVKFEEVPIAVRQRNSQVLWKDMAGMRDRLIHGYFGIDNEIVWKTAKEFAPEIRSEIESILNRERSNGKKEF